MRRIVLPLASSAFQRPSLESPQQNNGGLPERFVLRWQPGRPSPAVAVDARVRHRSTRQSHSLLHPAHSQRIQLETLVSWWTAMPTPPSKLAVQSNRSAGEARVLLDQPSTTPRSACPGKSRFLASSGKKAAYLAAPRNVPMQKMPMNLPAPVRFSQEAHATIPGAR